MGVRDSGPPTGTDAMGVVNEGREPCPDCGDIGIVPAVGLGYGGDAEPDMEPCRNPVHDGDVSADAVEAVKALRFRTMLRGRGNPDSEELHHTPAGAREVVEALRAIGWRPADTHPHDDVREALSFLLDRFYKVIPNGATIRDMGTDELKRRQTSAAGWNVQWPNVSAVLVAREALHADSAPGDES